MRRVFEATRPDGVIVKRTSMNRVYSHCVVVWCEATHEVTIDGHIYPARPAAWARSAEWASRLDLAQRNAAAWNARHYLTTGGRYRATVLQAREVTKPIAVNEQKIADRIDGYDRDDLGESPDY